MHVERRTVDGHSSLLLLLFAVVLSVGLVVAMRSPAFAWMLPAGLAAQMTRVEQLMQQRHEGKSSHEAKVVEQRGQSRSKEIHCSRIVS